MNSIYAVTPAALADPSSLSVMGAHSSLALLDAMSEEFLFLEALE